MKHNIFDTIQPYLSVNHTPKDKEPSFDLSICTDNCLFEILELSAEDVRNLLDDVAEQLEIHLEAFNEFRSKIND